MFNSKFILLLSLSIALFSGCGLNTQNALQNNKEETNNTAKTATFSFPQEFFDDFELYYDWSEEKVKTRYSVRKFGFDSNKRFSSNRFNIENETLIEEQTHFESGYELKNGKWIKSKEPRYNSTLFEQNSTVTLEGRYRFKIKSIENVEGKQLSIRGCEENITMPKNSKLTTIEVQVLRDLFELDYQEDYASLDEVILNNCNKNYFMPILEVDDVIAISFKCDQNELFKGTLMGVKKDSTLIEGVGSWQKKRLENSQIEALVIEIDKKYNSDNDTPFYAIKDKTVWKGYYDKKGTKFEIKGYNKTVLNAFISKIEQISKKSQKNPFISKQENNNSTISKIIIHPDTNRSN